MTRVGDALLRDTLAVAVPIRISALAGMEPWLRALMIQSWAAEAAEAVASRGDVLMFGGKRGEAAEVFNHLAKGLAALAHAPGGVHFAGLHFHADPTATA